MLRINQILTMLFRLDNKTKALNSVRSSHTTEHDITQLLLCSKYIEAGLFQNLHG